MNHSLAVFLIRDDARALACSYEGTVGEKLVDYKTLDKTIKVGDLVVVPTGTRHGMTVVKVEKESEPNFDSTAEMKWIIGPAPVAEYEALKAQEDRAIEQIKQAEKERRRRELKTDMERMVSEAGNGATSLLKIGGPSEKTNAVTKKE